MAERGAALHPLPTSLPRLPLPASAFCRMLSGEYLINSGPVLKTRQILLLLGRSCLTPHAIF